MVVKNWGKIGEGDPDQNVIDWTSPLKIDENRSKLFEIFCTETDRQTDRATQTAMKNIASAAEVTLT